MPSGVQFPQPETKQAFLAALEQTGKATGAGGACELAGVSQPIVFKWREQDPEFAAAWTLARRMHFESRAEKGWQVVDEILADESHKDRLAAAKVAIERADTVSQRNEGADDGIAEAIDRFTALVAGLARPKIAAANLQDALAGRAALPPADTDRPGES